MFPCSLGLLRAASPTGRALRAPLAPPAALRPSIAHCASLRVLATPALRASDVWPSRLCRLASSHRPALTLARCSVAAHCASLRVLATSALRAFDGQRPGRECIFTANASICSAKNARNDVHAVISDLSLVLPILCQCSELPLESRGAFWIVALPYEVALSKSLLFPEGKREVARRSRDGGIGKPLSSA